MRLSATLGHQNAAVEADGYVPLVIRIFETLPNPPNYWRIGDFKKSLIEFGFDRASGKICKAVVTSVSHLGSNELLPAFKFDLMQDGLPIAAPDMWANSPLNRIDEEHEIDAALKEGQFTVLFGSRNPSEAKSLRCGRVAFLLDEQTQFCGVVVFEMSPEEIENLRFATNDS